MQAHPHHHTGGPDADATGDNAGSCTQSHAGGPDADAAGDDAGSSWAGDGSGEGTMDEMEPGSLEGGVGRGSTRGASMMAVAQWWDGLLRDR